MAVISVLRRNGNNVTKAKSETLKNIKIKDVNYHFAKQNEVTDNVCEGAVNEPLIDMQIDGNSVQKTYSDENLLDISLIENGTFDEATGEPIASAFAEQVRTTYFVDVANGSQIVQNGTTNVRAFYWDLNENYLSTNVLAPNTPVVVSQNCKVKFVSSSSGFSADMEIKLAYMPPTPEAPIEVQSVGNKTSNLADLSKATVSSSTQHTTFSYDNKTGTLELTSTPNGYDYALLSDVNLGLEVGKTYYWGGDITVSGKTSTNQTVVIFELGTTAGNGYYFTNDETRHTGGTFTYTGQDKVNLRMFFNYGSPEPAKVTFSNIYVSEVKDEFEPAGYYNVPVKIGGKNLINIADNSTVSSPETIDITNECPKGVPIALSANLRRTEQGERARVRINYVEDGTKKYLFGSPITTEGISYVTGIIPVSATSISITMQSLDTTVGYLYWSNIQLEKGEIVTAYEPYIEPVTINILLSEPLRKVGDYADYIDYKNKNVVRKIFEYEVTGDEEYSLADADAIRTPFNFVPSILTIDDANSAFYYNCSHVGGGGSYTYLTTYSVNNPTSLEFRKIVQNWGVAEYTIDAWVSFVQSEMANKTPITIQYILAIPTEETIDIPEIMLADGNVIFDIQTDIEPSATNITYWKQI